MQEHKKNQNKDAPADAHIDAHIKEENSGDRANPDVCIKESEYLKLKEEAKNSAELLDRLLRLQADSDNLRKRLEKEKRDFIKYANEGLILELLNVLDDLERSVQLSEAKHQDLPAFLKGVEMILAHLYQTLKDHGIKHIEAEGKIFDPNFHEALMQWQDNNLPENTVVEELQKGYLLHDKVIRTAKVKVSKKSPQSADDGSGAAEK